MYPPRTDRLRLDDIPGMKVTVMGLGLHGGGIATARFFAALGADVLVTDLRSARDLESSVKALADLPIRFRLGEHLDDDFRGCDLVLKNPAVPPSAPLLALAPAVTNDIAVFLSLTRRPILAITGTKGKSTTASAVHFALKEIDGRASLGGNITVSPLTFLLDSVQGGRIDEPEAPVVLELSSWQLADCKPERLLDPQVSMITNIMHDHQNRYDTFEEYVDDKRRIFGSQSRSHTAVFNADDPRGQGFAAEAPCTVRLFSRGELPAGREGGFLRDGIGILRTAAGERTVLSDKPTLPGEHNRLNLLAAAVMLDAYGASPETTGPALTRFPGIPHRLEAVGLVDGVACYNDSAATIPQAAAAAIASFEAPVRLIAGGTDKDLDFGGFAEALATVAGIYLLEGSATPRFEAAAAEARLKPAGPYGSLREAISAALDAARPGEVLLLSPGCASFGMFKNEFDRGNQFREIIAALAGNDGSSN